jgi:hypothetical protein
MYPFIRGNRYRLYEQKKVAKRLAHPSFKPKAVNK